MQEHDLLISDILRHGAGVYGQTRIVTFTPGGGQAATFREVAQNAARLASALGTIGIRMGDRVATLAWNTQEHLETYFAVPGCGAVLHTLNLRLAAEQLEFVVSQAQDRVIIVHAGLLPLITNLIPRLPSVEHVVVIGESALPTLPGTSVHRYRDLLAAGTPEFDWPAFDERTAAAMCYTSGTTGMPKGIVYSHRALYVHSMLVCSANAFGLCDRDRVMPIVPMFHAHAWGMPYAAFLAGAEMLLVGEHPQPAALLEFITAEQPTVLGAVPTILSDLLETAQRMERDLSCLRLVVSGGSAVPRWMVEAFRDRHGVRLAQAWGMTETGPLVAITRIPREASAGAEIDWTLKTGRILASTEVRVVDEADAQLPHDGTSIGELEVRGPCVTASYYGCENTDKFHDGWLRTGDVGTIDESGTLQLTDRLKDVIKSGGEWISSVELENVLVGHPAISDAAVISVADPRWQERPLACVVLREGASATASELRDFLAPEFVSWWLPENWIFLPEIPTTSVGKKDKKELRALCADGEFLIERISSPGQIR